ncbi:MAG TPA: SgcJ/EcaC family oxidoreductase [Bryobacteraceae bacterium]|jgi:uncharacterized protein (TIGR02246 family)
MRTLFAVLLILVPLTVLGQSSEEGAVRAVVQKYVDAREVRDPKVLAALFTEDADQLVSDGVWRKGREAVVKGTLESSGRASGHRTIVVESVRFVTPDVAIAEGRYSIAAANGVPARNMWTSIVLTNKNGWRIAGIRNMLPAAR